MMSHEDPQQFLRGNRGKFDLDFREAIREIKSKAKEGSIDALIFGGQEGDEDYIESIKLLGKILEEELNFEPMVVTGPNMRSNEHDGGGPTKVYLDTQNRRLYIVRPTQTSEDNKAFLPSEIKYKE
ncbi:MAG TPA: hypothetical protein VGO63_00190 [Candidatus Paceibacterota bacterium]|jgi:hypothetical protein|nr:hypothetical protein [Candidatus Paceibacterota bacterium]